MSGVRHKHLLMMAVLLLFGLLILSGCSLSDMADWRDESADRLDRFASGEEVAALESEGMNEEGLYIDDKTGEAVSETQFYAYRFTDAFKRYGMYVAIPSFVAGFLIRRVVKSSASIRKIGLVLEIYVPIAYVILAYLISALADRL